MWREARGRDSWLYDEGWPKEQRIGRKIGRQRLQFLIDPVALTAFENGAEFLKRPQHKLTFTKAYLYLQLSSHSNYPPREIFFDDIEVKRRPEERR